MIEAYSHVPYPFGTVVASDVFSSGIVLSDTDFRQFEGYLGVTGLDVSQSRVFLTSHITFVHGVLTDGDSRKQLPVSHEEGFSREYSAWCRTGIYALIYLLVANLTTIPSRTLAKTRSLCCFISLPLLLPPRRIPPLSPL